jgi:hypothetical protein
MKFFGREFTFEQNLEPQADAPVGEYVKQAIARELPQVVANAKSLQAAKAEQAKRQRQEDRDIARLIGQQTEE